MDQEYTFWFEFHYPPNWVKKKIIRFAPCWRVVPIDSKAVNCYRFESFYFASFIFHILLIPCPSLLWTLHFLFRLFYVWSIMSFNPLSNLLLKIPTVWLDTIDKGSLFQKFTTLYVEKLPKIQPLYALTLSLYPLFLLQFFRKVPNMQVFTKRSTKSTKTSIWEQKVPIWYNSTNSGSPGIELGRETKHVSAAWTVIVTTVLLCSVSALNCVDFFQVVWILVLTSI